MKKYFRIIVVVIILGSRFLGIHSVDNRNIVLAKPHLYLNAYPPPGPSAVSNFHVNDDIQVKRPRAKAKIRFIRNRRENNGGWGGLGSRLMNSLSPGNLLGSATSNDDRYEEDTYAAAGTGYGHSHGGGGGHGGYGGGGGHGGYGGGGGHGGYGGGGGHGGYGGGGGHGGYGGYGGGYGHDSGGYGYGGGGHGGGGHGGGGHGKGTGHLNNSAVGLLGFLSLLSLIQTVLNQTTTTTAAPAPGRKKRDYDQENLEKGDLRDVGPPTQADKIIQLLLPVLSAIAHARDELIPVECTLRQVCLANQILVRELGAPGRSVGNMLSDGIGRILKEVDKTGTGVSSVKKSGKAGRMGKKCHKLYHECPVITHLPHYYIPSTMTF